jgi:hypothetical protein
MARMKRVFRIGARAGEFQSLQIDIPLAQFREIGEAAGGDSWSAPPFVIENPLLRRADFLYSKEFGLACPLSLVREYPGSGIERDCDLYPVRIANESQAYVIFRPRRALNEATIFDGDSNPPTRKLRASAINESFLFRMNHGTNDIYAAVVEGPEHPRDHFVSFAQRFTGLAWYLVAEA